jgi:aminomethyltransferase
MSPTLKKPIGMAYVPFEEKTLGNKLEIEARGKRFPIEIVKIPFVK